MAWFDNLFQRDPEEYAAEKAAVQQMGAPPPQGADKWAPVQGPDSLGAALQQKFTDPNTFLNAMMMLPGPGGMAGKGMVPASARSGPVSGALPAVQGPQARLGRGQTFEGSVTRVGAEGAAGAGRGGLPATQGGLPAVAGRSNYPAVIQGAGGAAASTSNNGFRNLLLAALGVGGASMMWPDEEPPAQPEGERYTPPQPQGRNRGGNAWDSLIARNNNIGYGDTREFAQMPMVDYENMTRPEFESARNILVGTAPEAPAERSWTQDLASYAIPALSMGMLGPLGLLVGGLMGDGNRRDNNQARQDTFTDESNAFQRELADFDLGAARETRGFDLADATGNQNQVIAGEKFQQDQRGERRDETKFIDDRALAGQQMIMNALGTQRTGQQLEAGDMQLNAMASGQGQSATPAAKMFDQLLQFSPQIAELYANSPEAMALGLVPRGDPRHDAAMVQFMMRLRGSQEYGPAINQLEQQSQAGSFGNVF